MMMIMGVQVRNTVIYNYNISSVVVTYIFHQISMSAAVVFTVVVKMLHAVTLMAVTHVTAILGGAEVDSIAQV